MKKHLALLYEWALMVLISAFFFVAFYRLNDLLFGALQHADGINWLFLPAGFRVLLVLVFGLPGAIGIVLGNLWLDHTQLSSTNWELVLLTAAVSGLGPWVIKYWMETRSLLDRQLSGITSVRLLNFVLVYAGVNAVGHQLIRWLFHVANSKPWIDVWPMFVGDALGAMAILYAVKYSLPWLRHWARKLA